ncbi:hypothetical protein JL721_5675 [Aureococcus anophagefferens]|nr:hypothetical protein JL721_5675 [Aureococcus anophagefferens]
MELVTGDETGLLKALRVDGGSQQQQRIGDELQSRSRGVCRLALDGAGDGPERFHAALASGCVETYERHAGDDGWRLASVARGLAPETVGLFAAGGRVVSCGRAGDVQVSSLAEDCGGVAAASEGKDGFDVSAAAYDAASNRVLLGGKETELACVDLASGARVWRAKNVPHDKLDMRRPVFVGAAAFLGEHEFVVGTAYAELRFYDARASRRPVHEVAGATGDVRAYDARTRAMTRRFAGPSGSVRELAAHPDRDGLFAACSLDRHVYVWDAAGETQAPVATVYCKQRLRSFLWLPDDEDDVVADLEDSDED